ncbi:MAG: hypothetical protein V3T73_00920 [Dehalococcoidales bacterium]|jgi:hypothetical protein
MNSSKYLAAAFLGLLLFLSLSLFGLAFTLNMTVLNAGFVTSQLEGLDIAALIEEAEIRQAIEDVPELAQYPELESYVEEAITEHEGEIKERISIAINDIYDYLLGKSQGLDLALVLSDTILDPELTISILNDIDLSPLVEELFRQQVAMEPGPGEFRIEPYLDDVATDLEPWLKEQVANAIGPIYDYLLGQSQSLELRISLEPIRESLENTLRQAFLEAPPAELAGLSVAELEQAFDRLYAEFATGIPQALVFDPLDPEIPAQVAESLADAEEALGEARGYVNTFQAVYGILIGLILLLFASIILITRQVKGSSRILGITFLTYGVLVLVASFIAVNIIKTQIVQQPDIPASIQTWLSGLLNSAISPLQILCIVLIVAAVALLAVSFIYKRHPSAE